MGVVHSESLGIELPRLNSDVIRNSKYGICIFKRKIDKIVVSNRNNDIKK
jgi:hypothetical protein